MLQEPGPLQMTPAPTVAVGCVSDLQDVSERLTRKLHRDPRTYPVRLPESHRGGITPPPPPQVESYAPYGWARFKSPPRTRLSQPAHRLVSTLDWETLAPEGLLPRINTLPVRGTPRRPVAWWLRAGGVIGGPISKSSPHDGDQGCRTSFRIR
ncbi:hypothetical protein BO70DRAFT_136883 [Aspergillus heteromorphus CBS 117.55]|uniref:Uncharacterized protein n=1 Tax=Aspergillus heteromorphus CBS 117.55 TaxID=1448321 RepID=A0A317WUY2_9EURO|nr:uncharacterized protein BO70DRAFT_136883 [Aspergillus heteromorphus CBS 117.55]PWY90234.1 hypothetical protein BO70DRAFT_136883 [Aspergillus heteromorphus CBS 117.55]